MPENEKLSLVIPTRNRRERLLQTLSSLACQSCGPEEVIVVDAGDDVTLPAQLTADWSSAFARFSAFRATQRGAAIQRNEGVAMATGNVIGFCDDDVDFAPECIARLRDFLSSHPDFGGVAATVTNQAPRRVGKLTRAVLGLFDTGSEDATPYDGRVIGPGLNIYPIFDPKGHPVRETEWLNLGATLYRRIVLPNPLFDSVFLTYSSCEDVGLSCRVARRGRLAVLRDAQIFHDSQPGDHKSDVAAVVRMEALNRFFIATKILGHQPVRTWFQLLAWYCFCLAANMKRSGRVRAVREFLGAVHGLSQLAGEDHEKRRFAAME